MIVYERRASVALHNVLFARADARPFLIPANVCPVVIDVFDGARQPFELVDIVDPGLHIDEETCLEWAAGEAIGGVVFVRPYGSERDPSTFFARLRAQNPALLIIDDKCLCAADCTGERVSQHADVTLFSTGHAKYADVGYGGFAYLRDGVPYGRSDAVPGWLDVRVPERPWAEYRDAVVEAAQAASAHKRALNAIYSATIPTTFQMPVELQNWRFNVRVPEAERLVADLFAHGLFASRHYEARGNAPVAARVHAEIVNLFNDRYFTHEQAQLAATLVTRHTGMV